MATNVKYLPLLFASIANAELLSEHNEPHAANQAALDRLYDAGCTRTLTTRSGRYGLHSTDSGEYQITGVTLTVKCTRWAVVDEPELADIELTWTRPTLRMYGAALPPDQISGYMLNADGVLVFVSGGNTLRYLDDDVRSGVHTYSIATVDTSAQIGPYSLPLTVTVD
jgi:hypothetical protein